MFIATTYEKSIVTKTEIITYLKLYLVLYTDAMEAFQDRIRKHLEKRGWDELRPSDIAKSITIEAAELLEIFQWDNLHPQEVRTDEKKMEKIRKELSDVMIYCFDMASILGIDMDEAVNDKLTKVQAKYPVEFFNKEIRASEAGTEEVYWKIKEKHRREGTN